MIEKEVRAFTVETSGGIDASQVVKAGTDAGEVDVAGADDTPIGVAKYDADQDKPIDVITDGVVKVIASGTVNRLTSSVLTKVVCAASGKVKALPATAGTYAVLGHVDNSQANVADGAALLVKIRRETVTVAGT